MNLQGKSPVRIWGQFRNRPHAIQVMSLDPELLGLQSHQSGPPESFLFDYVSLRIAFVHVILKARGACLPSDLPRRPASPSVVQESI